MLSFTFNPSLRKPIPQFGASASNSGTASTTLRVLQELVHRSTSGKITVSSLTINIHQHGGGYTLHYDESGVYRTIMFDTTGKLISATANASASKEPAIQGKKKGSTWHLSPEEALKLLNRFNR